MDQAAKLIDAGKIKPLVNQTEYILETIEDAYRAQTERSSSFKSFNATVTTTGDDFAGSMVDFTTSATSTTTDNGRRDKHIAKADFCCTNTRDIYNI